MREEGVTAGGAMRSTEAGLLAVPPSSDKVTDYDLKHAKLYLRLLDANAEGADWREPAHIVLGLDCDADPIAAERIHAAHLERALWMTREGYKDLLGRVSLN